MDISPDKENIDSVFSTMTYHIDFYQRDYRWTEEPVRRLLDDVFFKFREQYHRLKDLDPDSKTIAKYPWYYLNTYVTNVVDGRVYVVDGQQRLTTLSLILMKLRHLAKKFNSRLGGWLESKIAGQSGYELKFWMNHVGHSRCQKDLFEGKDTQEIETASGITAVNMVKNFETISKYLDKELTDERILDTFIFYFLDRLVLINLSVEQTDVSMVFEVINDRGVRLRPYEIIKGKLLGQINKIDLDRDNYNGLWEDQAKKINELKEDELDEFFRFYLKAKFSNTRGDGNRFDGDYHRAMFSNDMDEKLGLTHAPDKVKKFLKNEFTYFTNLYAKLLAAYDNLNTEFCEVYYNKLLYLDAPFLLVLSACNLNDSEEDEKIRSISYEVDRYYSLLQLQNVYDSNEFADSLYRISEKIRGKSSNHFRSAFDYELTKSIAERRNVSVNVDPFSYATFKNSGINLNIQFKRYFFARIDHFLAQNMNLNPKHSLADLVTKRGYQTSFHIEHILSYNDENLGLFGNDEERFEQERNRLGGILLLKGRDNISSGNELYTEKLRSYANTLYWNETLREDSYKSKLDMEKLKNRYNLDLKPLNQFGPDEVEYRHKLLYELSSIIWE